MIDAVGYAASLGAALMWLPQGWRAIRLRHSAATLEGLSVAAYVSGVCFNALLLVYGLGTHGAPVVVAAAVNLAMSTLIVIVVRRARLRS